jgi:hypothetical protein
LRSEGREDSEEVGNVVYGVAECCPIRKLLRRKLMKHLTKNYLKDLKWILLFCLSVMGIVSAGIILFGLLYGQRPDRDIKISLAFVTGVLCVGGILTVTVDHIGIWKTIRSEHHAPPSVESMDMEKLHQRIEEVQQGHEKRNT